MAKAENERCNEETQQCVHPTCCVERSAHREIADRYQALLEQTSDGVLISDRSGRVEASNDKACSLFGLDRNELEGRLLAELFEPGDADEARGLVAAIGGEASEFAEPPDEAQLLDSLSAGRTIRAVRRLKSGREQERVWSALSVRRLEGGCVQVTLRDLSAHVQAAAKIHDLANFDPLTELPNRQFFRDQIESAIARAGNGEKQLALLFLDIDRFKQINDSLGHASGDALLKQVASRLRTVLRSNDVVALPLCDKPGEAQAANGVSRLGGDEFTIVVTDLDHPQDAARVARRVLHVLSREFNFGEQQVFVSGSIGIAVWPDDGADRELLLRSANLAMTHAKSRGGQVYEFFNESMNRASIRRLSVENRMRGALEREEFSLVYQPIRDARLGRVSAVEALVRWNGEGTEPIGPDEFIPVAEETGMIVDLGAWVLRTACRQMRTWLDRGFDPFRMSVNISVNQLRALGVVSMVEDVLYESNLSADLVELEITESSMLDENPNIMASVSQLMENGIGFALDDFGTGYSSLSALQRFPIERLKIDRSFVAGVGENESDESLTSAIVALARRLDLRVVAEGVETEEQARFLTDLGCHELQGYLFSRPLPPDELERYLTSERSKLEEGGTSTQ